MRSMLASVADAMVIGLWDNAAHDLRNHDHPP